MVTGPPEVDTRVEPNYNIDDNNEIDYDSTEDIALSSSASSSTSSYPKVDCDDDDHMIECPSNRNIKICNKQFCDGIKNCPNGEDENPEQCQAGEFHDSTSIYVRFDVG